MDEGQQPDAATLADDKEWEQASADFKADAGLDPGKPVDTKPKDDATGKPDPAKPVEGDEAAKKVEEEAAAKKLEEERANETPEQKTAREAKEAEEAAAAAKPTAEQEAARAVRESRGIQRELAADEAAMKEDIRKEMFSEAQTELTDADGDPIRTVADVMKLHNPNTKKNFTEEEATMWLLQAQKHLSEKLQEVEGKVQQIAEVNITLKDQSDNIRSRYGELLKSNPNGIREKLWDAFQKTLEKDPKTDIIIKAPVSLEDFYDTALAPYAKLAERLEEEAEAEDKAKKDKDEKERGQTRSDRADVVAGASGDTRDAEEKEWDQAAKAYYAN